MLDKTEIIDLIHNGYIYKLTQYLLHTQFEGNVSYFVKGFFSVEGLIIDDERLKFTYKVISEDVRDQRMGWRRRDYQVHFCVKRSNFFSDTGPIIVFE